jgi:PST family polysaccharide transporter
MLFVEDGFDLSATRKISVQRDDLRAINTTALYIWSAKGFLALIGFSVLLALVGIIPKLKEEIILFLILYGLVLSVMFFPTWLFLGLERMEAVSFIKLGTKLIVLVGVFTLVRKPEHYLLYACLISFGEILFGVIGVIVAFRMFRLRFYKVPWSGVLETLKEGQTLFLSRALVSLYTAGNAFILGVLTNNMIVGYYSAAEKIVKSISSLLWPVTQAAYPGFNKLAAESWERTLIWSRWMLAMMGGLGFFLMVGVLWGAPLISDLLLGPKFALSIAVMRVLAPTILLNAISNVLGTLLMLPLGRDRAFISIYLGASFLNILLAILLVPVWEALGMAIAVLISQFFVTIMMFIYTHTHITSRMIGQSGTSS